MASKKIVKDVTPVIKSEELIIKRESISVTITDKQKVAPTDANNSATDNVLKTRH